MYKCPIEHERNMIRRRIPSYVHAPRTLNQLQNAFVEEWENILQNEITHLIQRMPEKSAMEVTMTRESNYYYS